MVGNLLRLIVRFCVRRYYRRVTIEGTERIPPAGSVLLCANHPNSLFDPALVGIASRREVHFLAKAPLFKMPVLGAVMSAMWMIPAYRGRDDQSQVRRNMQTLDAATEKLKQGRAVGIFPEGLSHDRLGVEMVRSGAARMAFQAIDGSNQRLQIVPIGLNYEDKERFRSDVWVRVGEPIDVVKFKESQDGHPKQVQRQFTAELDQRLKSVAIHLEDEQWEPWLYAVDRITSHLDLPVPETHLQAPPVLRRRFYLAEQMNQFIGDEPERANQIGMEITRLQNDAEALGVSLDVLCRELSDERTVPNRFGGRLVSGGLLLIPALLGTIVHAIPYGVVRLFSSRLHSKVNRTDVSLYRLLLSIPAYLATYFGIVILLLLLGWWQVAIAALVVMPLLGVIAFEYWPAMLRLKTDMAQQKRVRSAGDTATQAARHYEEVRTSFEQIMSRDNATHIAASAS